MIIMNQPAERMLVPTRLIRQAAAIAEVDDRTGIRIVFGFPTRPAGRERFLNALKGLGVDVAQLPAFSDMKGDDQTPPNPKIAAAVAEYDRNEAELDRLVDLARGEDTP